MATTGPDFDSGSFSVTATTLTASDSKNLLQLSYLEVMFPRVIRFVAGNRRDTGL
jgi:hypothetical protein